MWYDTPQEGGARYVYAGGLPDLIYRFPDCPRRPGGLPVCDNGRAGVADAEKAAPPAALPASVHPAGGEPVRALPQSWCVPLLCGLLCHSGDVHPVGSVGVANRILEGLFRRVYGRRVSSVHVLPVPDPAPEQRTPVYSGDILGCGSDLSPPAAPSALRALVPLSAGGGLRPAPDGLPRKRLWKHS